MRTSWAEVTAQIAECEKCRLCETRTNVVPGEGNPSAEWQAGLPDAAAACERDLSGYGLWRYEGNSKGEIKHEQE